MEIRPEKEADRAGVQAVNEAAFESTTEANLVVALHRQARPLISLVATDAGTIIGHIMFSPVELTGHPELNIMGLAPMAILPQYQRKGIGSKLVLAGLKACGKLGCGAVVVLGHPDYYPRFGFQPSINFGITCEYDVPVEAFMTIELQPGYLQGKTGTICYHAAFNNL